MGDCRAAASTKGETDEAALRRELAEEAGLDGFELGSIVWTRRHLLEFGDWDGQVERYYLVRAPGADPAPRLTWAQLNAEYMTAIRWWTGRSWRQRRTSSPPAASRLSSVS